MKLVKRMNRKVRVLIGIIGSLGLCMFGLYNVINENLSFGPIILGIGGFIGLFGGILELKNMKRS
ncbi:hypothetical protein SAMN05192533_11522 [Mesobacillus persicus]|uniref:Uncharacterized protein n=1 Tax=Mesobacillus persicus TaxID=930146 RepID=A0A1H8HHR8_9BACI|nr:hypothetical protein [Mesobacillus persicus]SEN55584.1 hypothetical protein SAMN05192533_11522 [Mesobacillus persicus]